MQVAGLDGEGEGTDLMLGTCQSVRPLLPVLSLGQVRTGTLLSGPLT